MYEYLASVQSAVRRVNDRLITLSKNLGTNSNIVRSATALIDTLLPDNIRYKDGVAQIMKPSDIYNDPEKMQLLSDIENRVKTWGHYRQVYEREYLQYKDNEIKSYKGIAIKGKQVPYELRDFINVMDNLDKLIHENYNELPDKALEILRTKGRKNTYSELLQVHTILKDKGFE